MSKIEKSMNNSFKDHRPKGQINIKISAFAFSPPKDIDFQSYRTKSHMNHCKRKKT